MIVPIFTFDEGANGYLSEAIEVDGQAVASIELASAAPVVTLKQEEDGGWANYGQSPKDARCYEITMSVKGKVSVRLATPVQVLKCYIV